MVSVSRKKSPNVYKKNVGDLGKLIVAKGFKKLPKVEKSPNLVTLVVLMAQLAESLLHKPEGLQYESRHC